MASLINLRTISLGLVATAVAFLFQPVNQHITTLGFRRPLDSLPIIHGHETKIVPDTQYCEDVHYHAESGYLYTACQLGDPTGRYQWFPPLSIFTDQTKAKGGALFAIDPKTFKPRQLTLQGFKQDFVTHGIDVTSDPKDSGNVYIFAVNHLPSPGYYLATHERPENVPKGRSQIEVFTHKSGSDIAVHKRSIRSPLITTPNDILATGPNHFYVTNDHHYREGLGRQLEDFLTRGAAPWTNISDVVISDIDSANPTTGFSASTAMRGLHNNNGLGHPGPDRRDEVLVTDASGGVMYRLARKSAPPADLEIIEEIQMPIMLDNPSWYEDEWKTPGNDASGYILNGLARGCDLAKHMHDPTNTPAPVHVYHVRADSTNKEKHADWEQRLVYSDTGAQLNSVSGAAVVGIDPAKNGGKKQGWLFMTGFASKNMVATKIDL